MSAWVAARPISEPKAMALRNARGRLLPEVVQGDLKALVVHLLVFAHGLFRALRAAVEELDDVCNRRCRSSLIEFFNAGRRANVDQTVEIQIHDIVVHGADVDTA